MCYGKDDNVDVICPKHYVEGKPAKHSPAETSIENRESIGRNGNKINQATQLVQKANRRPNAPLGVPGGGFLGVL